MRSFRAGLLYLSSPNGSCQAVAHLGLCTQLCTIRQARADVGLTKFYVVAIGRAAVVTSASGVRPTLSGSVHKTSADRPQQS